MAYTDTQIKNAKRAYNNFVRFHSVQEENPEIVGMNVAQQRSEHHNSIVREIKAGNKETIRFWKMFFINEEVKKTQKAEASRAKISANKAASEDVIAPIRKMRKMGEFGKWMNVKGNQFRSQHFSKKYTQEAVDAFIESIS